MNQPVKGFSKWTKEGKIEWIAQSHFAQPDAAIATFKQYWHPDAALQKKHDEFIENTVSNYFLPLGVAPNFLINNRFYSIPMAIEESSVVAAAAKAAQFWMDRGGFRAEVLSSTKIGHVHFLFHGNSHDLHAAFPNLQPALLADTDRLTANMQA
ncbi:MAG: hydroxymethylglutaryl-CoA reductase, partial [Schleiferiaceae bacterium]|nr:hydroxymethylglutaryl-CoA reductase [Schleiferiaceae bacterium]